MESYHSIWTFNIFIPNYHHFSLDNLFLFESPVY